MPLPIKTSFENRNDFLEQLKENPGLILIKFGAEWCGPCKRIESTVNNWFDNMTDNVQCYIIDVDDNFDVYAYLKNKKMVTTIPSILCYFNGNISYIPDLLISSSDINQINAFFQKCMLNLK
jgi:thioredoxin 1